ncbi:MAG TPA: iron ABC transporter permease [Chloroflexota bacterium]|nr:iron ABC transporter permease [Chloroflexota bacterium]
MAETAEAVRLFPAWRLPRLSGPQLAMVLLLAGLGFYILYPPFLILVNSFNTARIGQPAVYSLHAWQEAWRTPGLFQSLWNTLWLAFWYQLISFPVSILLAWLLARTNIPGARKLELMFWLSFFIPALSTTLGWMLLLDPRTGLINQILVGGLDLARGPFNVYSFWGIVWVHLMSHELSFKVMLLTPAFRNMDGALEESSRMAGAGQLRTLLRVTLPVLTPALVIVFMLGLVRLFESFEIELLLGVPFKFFVYSTKILDLVRDEPPHTAQATALGSVTLLLLLIVAPLQRWLTTRRSFTTVTGRMRPSVIDLGRGRWPVFALVLLLGAMLVLVPIFSVVAASFMTRFGFFNLAHPWTLAHWTQALHDSVFVRSVRNTLTIALTVATVGPLLFSIVAYMIVRARVWGRGALDLIVWAPSVMPGALAGLGLLWMFLGTPVFNPFYGTLFLLIIASMMGGVTFATQTLKATLLQLGHELEEASRTSGASWLLAYFRIILPLLAPTLIVVATLKFLFAANDTSRVILLATSDTRTLSLLTLDYVREGLRESAAVTTVIITSLTVMVALVARRLGFNMGIRA